MKTIDDQVLRASLQTQNLRVIFVDLHKLFSDLIERHQPPLSCKEHFLKAISSGLLTGPLLHEQERYTLRWHYGQSLEILIDVNHEGGVRAILSPPTEEEEMEIERVPGKLGLVKSSPTRRLNDGMVLADLCDPALDLATFFTLSDQIPTFCRVINGVKRSRGMLIQALPGCDPEKIKELEARSPEPKLPNDLNDLQEITSFLTDLLGEQVQPSDLKIHSRLTPHEFCTCSRVKMRVALASFPASELEDMIREDGGAQIDCQFCEAVYRFEALDLRELIDSKGPESPS